MFAIEKKYQGTSNTDSIKKVFYCQITISLHNRIKE